MIMRQQGGKLAAESASVRTRFTPFEAWEKLAILHLFCRLIFSRRDTWALSM